MSLFGLFNLWVWSLAVWSLFSQDLGPLPKTKAELLCQVPGLSGCSGRVHSLQQITFQEVEEGAYRHLQAFSVKSEQ